MSLGAVQRIVDMVAGKSSVQLLNFHGISTKHNSFFIANNSIQACGLGDAGLGVIVNKIADQYFAGECSLYVVCLFKFCFSII